MQRIAGYLRTYITQSNKKLFLYTSLILSLLIWVNYYFSINNFLYFTPSFITRFTRYFFLFASVFILTYIAGFLLQKKSFPKQVFFYILLVAAPAIFAVKVAIQTHNLLPTYHLAGILERYLNIVLQWPLKAVLVMAAVYFFWIVGGFGKPVSGLSTRNFNVWPYFLLLGAMVPLLVVASTGGDFQKVYPKSDMIGFANEMPFQWLRRLVFEICYGIDFFTIEFFFRGFLVLAFVRYAGKDAILPMAVFYCTIHFGKPLFECISSFFGGLILGVIVYHSRSIWGGLIIHLGIAWIMELIGIIK